MQEERHTVSLKSFIRHLDFVSPALSFVTQSFINSSYPFFLLRQQSFLQSLLVLSNTFGKITALSSCQRKNSWCMVIILNLILRVSSSDADGCFWIRSECVLIKLTVGTNSSPFSLLLPCGLRLVLGMFDHWIMNNSSNHVQTGDCIKNRP